MSQEKVEIVQRAMNAMLDGDLARAVREFDPDAEWHNTDAFPGPKVCRGIDEISAFWGTIFDAFGNPSDTQVGRIVEHEDVVVVESHGRATGKASGVPIEARWTSVFQLRAGKIVCVKVHGDFDKAIASLKLSKQDAHADT